MTLFAATMALTVSLLPPTIFFYQGKQFLEGSVARSVRLKSIQISALIGRNPELWRFESTRLDDILLAGLEKETYDVITQAGEHATRAGPENQPAPVFAVEARLYDAGKQVAVLSAHASLLPLLYQSFGLAILTTGVGVLSFIALKTIPTRLIHRAMDNASFLANHDPLTQLPNRSLFSEWLTRSMSEAAHNKTALAVLTLDLDRFKEVNDIFGHAAGDTLLTQVTGRMEDVLEKTDFIARIGGDEFCVVQILVPQPASSARLSEKLVTELSRPFRVGNNELDIGVSIGISVSLEDTRVDDPSLLIRQSDLALYHVKATGRGSYRFFEEKMNEKLVRRRWLEKELKQALAQDGLELHFQPQIDLAQNVVVGLEALCRWNHPEEGWIPPDQFIPIAEDTGLIQTIGNWVIREACKQAMQWPTLKIAVNVSPLQFRNGDLVDIIRDALALSNNNPNKFEIEITEGLLLQNTEQAIQTLAEIQALGVRIAMDDFGTGYSSLSYLRKFSFDKIKIDQSFVAGIGRGSDAEIIIESVVNLGNALGMISNAEGVETLEQAEWLRHIGCNEVQGYYFGKPMPASAITELLNDELWECLEKGSTATTAERRIASNR